MAVSHDDDAMAELFISSLPLETRSPPFPFRQYGGFWFSEPMLPGVLAAQARFEARPSDVFLASFPKSDTTWLKALAFATAHRVDHPPGDPDHPLRHRNPHDCVELLELSFALSPIKGGDVFAGLPSPRMLATHIPYSLVPERITAEGFGCKIVYICRQPKDAFVSNWIFVKKMATKETCNGTPPAPFAIEQAFDLFCDGRCFGGPQWHHVADYWEPELAGEEFMGCAFSAEEEAAGVVKDIIELCSIDALKNLEVNKNGSQQWVKNEAFFRKGVSGDWSNHMTPAMAGRLDKIVEDALQGTGFSFADSRQSAGRTHDHIQGPRTQGHGAGHNLSMATQKI
ncbi:unnamed protein product [Alopecurus aequalis]